MIIIVILYIVALVILLSLASFLVYKMINSNRSSPDEFIGLLTVLSSQIQTELDAYDKSVFENKGSITNNNFDNYYNDLTSRIIKNISPDMVKSLSKYYTEEAIYRFIARSVRDYLVSKINGTT